MIDLSELFCRLKQILWIKYLAQDVAKKHSVIIKAFLPVVNSRYILNILFQLFSLL